MKPAYFGDSFDIVKQSLILWMAPLGAWTVHPMFTADARPISNAFAECLGARLLSDEVLSPVTDRAAYFHEAHRCGHLFLDPDTGLWLGKRKPAPLEAYLLGTELLSLVSARPNYLTLVFDQSVGRGSERAHIEKKLLAISSCGYHAFAYVSHACFIAVAHDAQLVERAYKAILSGSRLPTDRFALTGQVCPEQSLSSTLSEVP